MRALQNWEEYKQFSEQQRKKLPSDTHRPDAFNFIHQIDFIGPTAAGLQKKYACATVDVRAGAGGAGAKATVWTLAGGAAIMGHLES